MKTALWLVIVLVIVTVTVLALLRDRQHGATAPETSPASVEEAPVAPRTDVASNPSTPGVTSRTAPPEPPVAMAAKARASNEPGSEPTKEESLPAEAKLHVGDVLSLDCVTQVMSNERFPEAIRRMGSGLLPVSRVKVGWEEEKGVRDIYPEGVSR